MKRFNLFDMYEMGRWLGSVVGVQGTDTIQAEAYNLWMAREMLIPLLGEGSPFLGSSRRTGQRVVDAISAIISRNWLEISQIGPEVQIGDRALGLRTAIYDFNTVLRGETPDVASYVVAQKGIFRTDDLIANAHKQIPVSLAGLVPPQAVSDIKEAGKCLAFELGTACAFHLWRAVESTIGLYYYQITGTTLQQAKINRNWGQYIGALEKAGADSKVTVLLRHLKDEFRNPQTHPEESVSVDEAQRLFSVAISAIEQMLATGYKVVVAKSKAAGESIPPAPVYPPALNSMLTGVIKDA